MSKMDFEIVGSSADYQPKRSFINRIKDMNPIWFVKTSLSFMEGYSKWYIWSRMPIKYIRYCVLCLKG